jgi:hypothetical protein
MYKYWHCQSGALDVGLIDVRLEVTPRGISCPVHGWKGRLVEMESVSRKYGVSCKQCCLQELQECITFMLHNIKAIVQPQSNTTIKYTKGAKRRFLVKGTLRFLAWRESAYSSRQARWGQNCHHHCETEWILETSTICWTTSIGKTLYKAHCTSFDANRKQSCGCGQQSHGWGEDRSPGGYLPLSRVHALEKVMFDEKRKKDFKAWKNPNVQFEITSHMTIYFFLPNLNRYPGVFKSHDTVCPLK